MSKIILEMKNITKTFPGVKALDNVNLKVEDGEIHALVGENGAGKSTLMKVLSGVHPYGSYTGNIIYNGEECKFSNIKDSEKKGIVIIHQELALVPYLSIAENMFLGNEIGHSLNINWAKTNMEASKNLKRVGLSERPETLIKDIGVGKRQLVEIAKALSKKVKLLILDEPTSSLNEKDAGALLELILELKKQGITSIIISHKLNEISYVADKITVIRDGMSIETIENATKDIPEERIVKGMVGREMTDRFPKRESCVEDEYKLEVKNWTVYHPKYLGRKVVDDVSFYVKKGELVGISGLMGAGRTELAMSIFGKSYGVDISGELFISGKKVELNTEKEAIEKGLAYVTEDRKGNGLILSDTIVLNTTLANLKGVSKSGVISYDREFEVSDEYREKLRIKCSSVEQDVGNLSGGNQQKVLLAKSMFTSPDILILDEPTRGIDVGAKYEIYAIMNQLLKMGKAIVMISSELPEILGMSDRIYVMNEGNMVAEFSSEEASQEGIMSSIVMSDTEE